MNTVAEINAEIENINQMLVQVDAEIISKKALVAELKKDNAKLVEQNLLKQRKPPSLRVQRQKIFDIECELSELKNVKEKLREALEKAKENLHTASIKHRIVEYRKAQDYHLAQICKAQDLLSQFKAVITEIEGLKTLEQLVRINADLDGQRLADYGIDLSEVLTKFKKTNLSADFDFSRIDNLNINLQNLISQLDSIYNGKRGYHQTAVQAGPQKMHTVNPLHQARLYEKQRLDSKDDLSKALKGKTQINQHTHR